MKLADAHVSIMAETQLVPIQYLTKNNLGTSTYFSASKSITNGSFPDGSQL
jgi:hypothetical protein